MTIEPGLQGVWLADKGEMCLDTELVRTEHVHKTEVCEWMSMVGEYDQTLSLFFGFYFLSKKITLMQRDEWIDKEGLA